MVEGCAERSVILARAILSVLVDVEPFVVLGVAAHLHGCCRGRPRMW